MHGSGAASVVAAVQAVGASYPTVAPFHPSELYPESPPWVECQAEPNRAYAQLRDTFHLAELDGENFGTKEWNPLGDLLREGETVLLKPNLVKEEHPRDPEGWRYVLTHGSVIRAVADYVWKAIGHTGRIILADAPQTDSSFERITRRLHLDEIASIYRQRGLAFELVDLRLEEWENEGGVITRRRSLHGDPRGGVAFDLGARSCFASHKGHGRYYGADYDVGTVNRHHSGGRHEYLIAGSAMIADAVFSLPKLKTHKKSGITVSLKNLVGINADKNWLPHHTEGCPGTGGDERPSLTTKAFLERYGARALRALAVRLPGIGVPLLRRARSAGRVPFGDTESVVRSGNWWGNDTIWRMCLDLNRILAYGNPDGTFRPDRPENRRRHFVLVDGIIAGEGRGPMNPDPVQAGVLVFGTSPPAVDAACAILMGFDPDRIPVVREAFHLRGFPLAEGGWRDVALRSNVSGWNGALPSILPESTMHFEPHFGWKGHIERVADVREQQSSVVG